MPQTVRVPITNVHMGGDYTGEFRIGPNGQTCNLILDTGSSALAVSGKRYIPSFTGGETQTRFAQSDSYGDGSHWTGAVLSTTVALGSGADSLSQAGIPLAVAYDETQNMFDGVDGILGLAYQALDDAYAMPKNTWTAKYPTQRVVAGKQVSVVPYLTQLANDKVLLEIVSFLTRRSQVHMGAGMASDPLNQGWMIIGGGVEATDLYTGKFQVAKVTSKAWYSTILKAIIVGDAAPIHVKARPAQGMPSNSIVDSGTNGIYLGKSLISAIAAALPQQQASQLMSAISGQSPIPAGQLDLAKWPTIKFVLAGETADVVLAVPPTDYWQMDAWKVGYAVCALDEGDEGGNILGLPAMNPYFTVFDATVNDGVGVIRFAAAAGK